MENIILNWIKIRFLNTKVSNPEVLEAKLNEQAYNMCRFEVLPDYSVLMFDESNFVKKFCFNVENGYIREITIA